MSSGKRHIKHLESIVFTMALSLLYSQQLHAGSTTQTETIKVKAYKLESLELIGTSRIDKELLIREFGLTPGVELNDTLVIETQAKLLSLGLFKSAILFMRRGSDKGKARLIVEVEDDPDIIGDWAFGGSFGITQNQAVLSTGNIEQVPSSYRLELISRNLFTSLHRGSLYLDVDSEGNFQESKVAYGLPYFTKEGVQFDIEASVVNIKKRYLSAKGFGTQIQGLWSQKSSEWGSLRYGMALYSNSIDKYKVTGFPKTVAGPKVEFSKENRLLSFIPGMGHRLVGSLLLSPFSTEESVVEIELAETLAIFNSSLSLTGQALGIANGKAYAFRAEARYDYPFHLSYLTKEKGELFTSLKGGLDFTTMEDSQGFTEKKKSKGYVATLGLRLHSSGFIGEFAIQITTAPEETILKKLIDAGGQVTK